jgi:hypothetical protein
VQASAALAYPPLRNAARSTDRLDWIGFDNCIKNRALQPLPPPRAKEEPAMKGRT